MSDPHADDHTAVTEPSTDMTMTTPPSQPAERDPKVVHQTEDDTRRAWLTPGRVAAMAAVVLTAYAAFQIIRALRSILIMLLVALFLSFAMEPAVQFLAKRGWRRGLATGLVFWGMILLVIASLGSFVPLLVGQVSDLIDSVPRSVDEINELLSRVPLVDLQLDPGSDLQEQISRWTRDFSGQLQTVALGAAGNVVGIASTVVGVIFQLAAIGLVTFYLVADGPRLRRALASPLPPHRQRELLVLWELAVAKTGGYIYSRVLLALASGASTAVALMLLGVDYPLPLGLLVGLSSAFIPVVGTYLGGAVALLVALIHRPITALWVLVFLVCYQQLENYWIAPKLQARTMDVHPAVAFVSVLVGGALLGAVGALLALPATAIIQALLSTYIHRHELIAEFDTLEAEEPSKEPAP